MRIGICDDEEIMRKKVYRICMQAMSEYDEDIEFIVFSNGKEVYADEGLDILVLDIEMPTENGIRIKNKLQEDKRDTIIIFVSGHDEMMSEAFGVNVAGFIVKNHVEEQLPSMLAQSVRMLKKSVFIEGIDSRKIDYIKSEHVYSMIHTVDNEPKVVRLSSKEIENRLKNTDFVRVHRAYIVNMEYIKQLRDKNIDVNGTNIPISVRLSGGVKKKYLEYCRAHARFC